MTAKRQGNRVLQILPGLLLSAVAIIALIWEVNWRETFQAWGRAQLWVMAPAAVLIVAAMLTRAAAWRCLMRNAVPLRKSFWVLNISYMLNGFLPFRLGDIGRAYLVSRPGAGAAATPGNNGAGAASASPEVDAGTALSAVALERVFDLIYAALLILLAFPALSGKVGNEWMLVSSIGLAAFGFLALLLLGFLSARIMRAAEWMAGKATFLRPGVKPLEHFLNGLRRMRDLRYSLPAFLLIGVTMLLWAAEYWVVLRGFVPDAAVSWGLLSLVGGLIGVALPSSPSSLGVFELSLTLVLTAGGMAREVAVAYALSIHMMNILSLSLLGLLGLLAERQSLGSILSKARSAENP
jgi:uncharacterized membrane protein YbhN (UPF0104 family)